jgi:ABC-type branched-subunit amino acid transport system substrate-binding protein
MKELLISLGILLFLYGASDFYKYYQKKKYIPSNSCSSKSRQLQSFNDTNTTSSLNSIQCTGFEVSSGSGTKDQNFIKVGILHSLTGSLALGENNLVDMALLALEEINNNGGLLGQKIKVYLEGISNIKI